MYILFAGHSYYPGGGARDWWGHYDNLSDALSYSKIAGTEKDWWHIYDVNAGEIVRTSYDLR